MFVCNRIAKQSSEISFYGVDTRDHFQYKNSLCKEVWGREQKVLEYAEENEVVIFVAGRNSSNGKSLFKHMKTKNSNMFILKI